MFIKLRRSLVKVYLVAFHTTIILWLIFGIMEILFQNNPFFPVYIRYIVINLYFPGPLWLLFTLEYLEIIDQKRRYLRWLILAPAILSSIPSFIDRCLFLTIREGRHNNGSDLGRDRHDSRSDLQCCQCQPQRRQHSVQRQVSQYVSKY